MIHPFDFHSDTSKDLRIIAADGILLMDAAVDGQFTENDTTQNHRLQGTGVLATAHFGARIWCPGDDVLI
tara:strand:- start:72 stop:281 length:210 start_codon:yes stop_codon:yes gene_type:complete